MGLLQSMNVVRPEFIDPPIIEQVFTVIFDKIPGFGIVDLGLFWSEIRDSFPHYSVAPRLPTQREVFGPVDTAGFEFSVAAFDMPRLMYRNDGGELIQLQDDRFSFNWAKQDGTIYPNSDVTAERFWELFSFFDAFLRTRNLPNLAIRQCEVTNLNIIPVADFGNNYGDVGNALKLDPLDLGVDFLVAETYVRNRQHRIVDPEGKFIGRLHTAISPVINSQDNSQAYRLELTARSAPDISDNKQVRTFFDVARNSINAGFLGIVTDEMRKKWGEINA